MMTRTIRTGIAVAVLLIAPIAAQAADLPRPSYKAPIFSAPGFSWTGFYVGLNGGYGWGTATATDPITGVQAFSTKATGWMGGGTIGYNMQTGSWVWGLEADIDYSTVKATDTSVCNAPGCEIRNDWLGTARGRIGYAFDRVLVYGTGGAAYGDIKMNIPSGGTTTSETKTKLGWTVGGGVEYAVMGAWTVKAEYLYVDLGNATCSTTLCKPDGATIKMPLNIARLGVNYRF